MQSHRSSPAQPDAPANENQTGNFSTIHGHLSWLNNAFQGLRIHPIDAPPPPSTTPDGESTDGRVASGTYMIFDPHQDPPPTPRPHHIHLSDLGELPRIPPSPPPEIKAEFGLPPSNFPPRSSLFSGSRPSGPPPASTESSIRDYPPLKTGSCRCGTIQMAIFGRPEKTMICHCSGCRKTFGSVFASLSYYDPRVLHIINEEAAGAFFSGETTRFWCQNCGTVYKMLVLGDPEHIIPTGILDGDNEDLAPLIEVHCSERTGWVPQILPAGLRYPFGHR
ncbi:Mss4-like protein [Jackrogersella minutella]|nr:Mss4-like protein [Jackrogersella minutella]